MASCLVTTTGTSGTFRLDFDLGAEHSVAYYAYGDPIYIDDSATNVTYTTLTGDVGATSGCVTITELERICYLIEYDRPYDDNDEDYNPTFDAIIVGSTIPFTAPVTDKPSDAVYLIEEINTNLDDDTYKVTAVKITAETGNVYATISLIIRVLGTDVPELRIVSPYGNYSYVKGVISADCVPVGFTDLQICETPSAP